MTRLEGPASGQREAGRERGCGGGVIVLGHQSDVGAADRPEGGVWDDAPFVLRGMAELWFGSGVCGQAGVSVTLSWRCLGDLQVEVHLRGLYQSRGLGAEAEARRRGRGWRTSQGGSKEAAGSARGGRAPRASSSAGHLMPPHLAAGVITSCW